jgi:NNP family nitrate/nitrite transporter-like MFS transporter
MQQSKSLKNQPYSWVVIFMIFIGCFVGAFAQYITAVFGGELMERFGVGTVELAAITTAPMLGGIILSIPAGTLADKVGIRATVTIAGAIGVIGAILRIFADSYGMLLFASVLLGIMPVFISANGAKIAFEWFDGKLLGIGVGIFMAAGTTGNAVAQAVTAYFPTWRIACTVTAALMLIGLVLCALFLRDRPQGATPPPTEHVMQNMGKCCKLPYIWTIGLIMVFVMAFNITISTFMPTALNVNGMPLTSAGLVASAFSFGGLFGSIFLPAIHDSVFAKMPRIGCLVYGVLAAVLILVAWFFQSVAVTSVCGFLAAFLIIGLMSVALTAMGFIPGMKPEYMGSAGGFQNSARFISACFVPAYVIANIAGDNYTLMFILCAACGVLAGVFGAITPDNHLIKAPNAQAQPVEGETPAHA